jgi:hypothetical protein
MFNFFKSSKALTSGEQLAKIVLTMLPLAGDKTDEKYDKKLKATMRKLDQQIDWLKLQHRFNFYQKAKLGNSFRWGLMDAGYPEQLAKELTQWVLVRFNPIKK